MNSHFSSKFNKTINIIHPGEYYATGDDVFISTVLGSCISVILYDSRRRIGGMNHFMLPKPGNNATAEMTAGKYGIHAMELLINAMYKLGSSKKDIAAKVFGGGSVLPGSRGKGVSVPAYNIDFAFTFLETENIPVHRSDVGGTKGRKILFDPRTSKVLLKRIARNSLSIITEEEKDYLEHLQKVRDKWGKYFIFSSNGSGSAKNSR